MAWNASSVEAVSPPLTPTKRGGSHYVLVPRDWAPQLLNGHALRLVLVPKEPEAKP